MKKWTFRIGLLLALAGAFWLGMKAGEPLTQAERYFAIATAISVAALISLVALLFRK